LNKGEDLLGVFTIAGRSFHAKI